MIICEQNQSSLINFDNCTDIFIAQIKKNKDENNKIEEVEKWCLVVKTINNEQLEVGRFDTKEKAKTELVKIKNILSGYTISKEIE